MYVARDQVEARTHAQIALNALKRLLQTKELNVGLTKSTTLRLDEAAKGEVQ